MSAPANKAQVKLVGADVFVRTTTMPSIKADGSLGSFELTTISNRGTKVWPPPTPAIQMTDIYGCRFMYRGADVPNVTALLSALEKLGFEWVHVEKLHEINGKPGFSVAQGE